MRTCGERILEALSLQPMTRGELAKALFANDRTVEQTLTRLERLLLVETAGRIKTGRVGARSYLWRRPEVKEIVKRAREWTLKIGGERVHVREVLP